MKKYFNSQDARTLIDTYDFAIFPIHGVKEDGSCTCNNINCNNIGKHPATPDGFKSASKDIDQVKRLWAGRKGLNVGIATGEPSGVFVVDIDNQQAEAELKKLIDLPNTYTVKTGRGKHLYFKYNPEKPIKNGTHIIPFVDIRGNGGYVAGAGSNHVSGVTYEALNPLEVFSEAPDSLYDLLNKEQKPIDFTQEKTRFLYQKTRDGWTQEQVIDHLNHINPDCDYDTWIKIGMALHAEGLPFHLFDDWSKRGVKYDGSTRDHWKSFTAGGGVTYGTVVALAKQGGWQFKRESVAAPAAPKEIINSETGEITEIQRRQIPFIYADDIQATLDTKDFVESLLRENEFSVTYGESNCGKTFFMLDLAMHVALGMEWRGLEVDQGGVIYAALEGGHGTKNRIIAFKEHHKVSGHIPLAVIPSNLNFLDVNGDLTALVEGIKQESNKLGGVKLIVVDTLARAISGGDENSSMDMGQLIINADILRSLTGAHINFIHHSGKDAAKGARGHSSLRAAVDTEIEISRENIESPSIVKVVKQREMEIIDDMAFTLSSTTLGLNRRGREVTSCVVLPAEATKKSIVKTLTPIQSFIFEAIVEAVDIYGRSRSPIKDMPPVKCVTYTDFHAVLDERGYKDFMETNKRTTETQVKNATINARISLKKAGKINFASDYIWLTE